MTTTPEALRLAYVLERDVGDPLVNRKQAAAMLRKLYAEVTALSDNALEDSQRIDKLEADIERKDALLKQALEVLSLNQSAHPVAYRNAREAITKELQ